MARKLALLVLFAITAPLPAGPRDREWQQVKEATDTDEPQTVISLLKPIESAAFADHAWGEGAKALAMRIALEGNIGGGASATVKKITAATATAPDEARPLLRLLQARWLFTYYQKNRFWMSERSATTTAPGDDFETWDLSRVLAEIDKRFQDSLADKPVLQKTPVGQFSEFLKGGDLGDELRPTLYDLIAHSALEFYTMEEVAASQPQDAFEITADSPALDSIAAFLAWHPQTPDATSPKLRSLQLYQDLLNFHQADPNPTAFLHCDLERLRWAGKAAVGPTKAARLDTALRAFIETHAKHPLSADARQDVANALIEKKQSKDARDFAQIGAESFPDHPFGKLCKKLVTNLEAKSIKLETETHWTPAGAEITLKHANLSHVWFRACRRDWVPDDEMERHDPAPKDETQIAALLNLKPVLAWDAALPDDKDFLQRSTTLPAPGQLQPGYYIIIASANDDFSIKNNCISCLPVHGTTLVMVVRCHERKLDGLVTAAVTGAPHEGIEVSIWPGTESTKTDADGWFSLPITRESNEFLVVAGTGADCAITRTPKHGFAFDDKVEEPRESIIFFTDRSIYRPGQTVHFKGIYCDANRQSGIYHTLAGKQATVILQDSNKKEVQTLEVLTNEHGSFSGTFNAPSGGLLGYFTISAKDLGQTSCRVEEYKRPKFFAELMPPAAPAALGARVTLNGKAEAYTGAVIDGATVTWRVTRITDLPSWIHWSEWSSLRNSDDREIANGTATTAADGSFPITFNATPDLTIDPKADPVFEYEVTADVTDPSGETRSAAYTLNVAYTTLKASIEMASWQEEGKPVKFHISTQSHDDEGRPAKGLLTIHALREPEQCSRGNLRKEYSSIDDEDPDPSNPANWKLGGVVKEIPVQTDQANTENAGEAEVSASLPAGIYRAVFVTKDANGRSVQAIEGFQVVKPSSNKFRFFGTIRVDFEYVKVCSYGHRLAASSHRSSGRTA